MKKLINQSQCRLGIRILVLLMTVVTGCSKDDEPDRVIKSSDKQITSFVFLLTKNAIANNVVATIDEDTKNITAIMPPGTDVRGLLPDIEIPETAQITPTSAQDFTTPVSYTVTAEDQSQTVYIVTVKVTLTQRQILKAILDANPENTIWWDLANTADLNELEGVSTDINGNISELILTDKGISVFNTEIANLTTLTRLYLNENKLTSIPPEIGQLTNLLQLNIEDNKLTFLPAEIGKLVNLHFLSASENNLTSLPPEFFQLNQLESLLLSDINLVSLPSEIGQLTKLTFFTLDKNELTFLPSEIFQLPDLEFLSLSNNALTSLPSGIGELSKLYYLSLINNKLTTLPPGIGRFKGLTALDLSGNQLTSLPREIGLLTKLGLLHIRDNQVTSLPFEIGFLLKLHLLSTEGNNLLSIPQCICNLKEFNNQFMTFTKDNGVQCETTSSLDALISIYSGNPHNTLTWGVDNYPEVEFTSNGSPRSITMNNKNLTRLPDNIDQLAALEALNVNGNPLGSLPAKIGNISTLNVITVFNTNITTVPPEFGQLKKLALLQLQENPISNIPKSVCDLQITNGGILTILTDPGEGCD